METIGFIFLIAGPSIGMPLLILQLHKHGILTKGQPDSQLSAEKLKTAKATGIAGVACYSVALACALLAVVIILFLVATFLPLLLTGQFEQIKAQAGITSTISDTAYTLAWIFLAGAVIAHIWAYVTLNQSEPKG